MVAIVSAVVQVEILTSQGFISINNKINVLQNKEKMILLFTIYTTGREQHLHLPLCSISIFQEIGKSGVFLYLNTASSKFI